MTAGTSDARSTPARAAARLPWRFVLPLLAATLLIGTAGGVVYRYLRNDMRDQAQRTLALIAEQKRQQIEGWIAETRIAPVDLYPVLAYATAIAGTPWLLIAKIDEDEAYAGIRTTAWASALAAGLGLLLIYSCGYLLWRRDRQRRESQASEREQAMAAEQRRTWQLLDAIAEGSTDAIFAKDTQGRYTLLNRAAAAMVGVPAEAALGRDGSALFPPEQAARIMADDRRAMVEDRAITTQVVITTVSGERVMLATKGPLHDAEGRVVGLFGISRDITERERAEQEIQALNASLEQRVAERTADLERRVEARTAEVRAAYEALRQSEEKYRSLVETTSDCIWEVDARARFTYLSPRLREWTGDPPENYIGKTVLLDLSKTTHR